jgi:hypothetical protein
MNRSPRLLVAALVTALAVVSVALAARKPARQVKKPATTPKTGQPVSTTANNGGTKTPTLALAVDPKPLSDPVKKGLEWLAKTQLPNGAWSQGEEAAQMRNAADGMRDFPNVADTCIAALALLRSGSTPRSGPYAENIRKALDYVCGEVRKADEKSMLITSTQGTRVQGKLGPYIDTFLAAAVLAEVRTQMPDESSRKVLIAALDKVMDKLEKNQMANGTWDNQGWAPALSQAVASKAVNRAAQNGQRVSEKTRLQAENYARGNFNRSSGGFGGSGSAGVELYAGASTLGALQDSDNTNGALAREAQDQLKRPTTPPAVKKKAEATLKRVAENRRDLEDARGAIIRRLDDKEFVAGFGSNGGEEFLSYMNIGESLLVKGGADWKKWDQSMTQNLSRVQNEDGSWSGHHCITGRTFCTSAALLTLMVDRTPVPTSSVAKATQKK